MVWLEAGQSVVPFVLVTVAVVLSFSACVWLVYQLLVKLPPVARRRLFPRMLLSLAIAEILAAISGTPVMFADFFPAKDPSWNSALDYWCCGVAYSAFRTMRVIVQFQEAQLALTFLAQTARWNRLLPVLDRGRPVVWIAGATVGLIGALTSRWNYAEPFGMCITESGRDWVSIIALVACMCISVVACVATFLRSACGTLPGSVQRRNYLRALSYIVVVLISYSTITVAYAHMVWAVEYRGFFTAACILEILNGFLNSAVYFSQSYGATKERGRLLSAAAIDGPRPARRVSNEGEASPTQMELGSIHVEFGGVDVLELLLPMELAWTESSLSSTSRRSSDVTASSATDSTASSRQSRRV